MKFLKRFYNNLLLWYLKCYGRNGVIEWLHIKQNNEHQAHWNYWYKSKILAYSEQSFSLNDIARAVAVVQMPHAYHEFVTLEGNTYLRSRANHKKLAVVQKIHNHAKATIMAKLEKAPVRERIFKKTPAFTHTEKAELL